MNGDQKKGLTPAQVTLSILGANPKLKFDLFYSVIKP